MKAEKREISVVGLGYIGLPTAVVLAQAGHLVKGYDVNPSVRESLSEGRIHIVENHLQEAFSAVQFSMVMFPPFSPTCTVSAFSPLQSTFPALRETFT